MTYLIETRSEISPMGLRDVILGALEDLNSDRNTDFRVYRDEPILINSTEYSYNFLLGRFEYSLQENEKVIDSILAIQVRNIGCIKEDLRRRLVLERFDLAWVVIPGLNDMCSGFTSERGIFYRNPSNEDKFNAYLVGKNIKGISGVSRVVYCWFDPKGNYNLITVE